MVDTKWDDEYAKTLSPRDLTLYSLRLGKARLKEVLEYDEMLRDKGEPKWRWGWIDTWKAQLKEFEDLIASIEADPNAYSHIK